LAEISGTLYANSNFYFREMILKKYAKARKQFFIVNSTHRVLLFLD